MSASVKLDDRHPQIRYSMDGEWIHSGKPQVEYNSTTTGTKIGGATVMIPFNGTRVAVFGSVAALNHQPDGLIPPQTSYSIDGDEPAHFLPEFKTKAQRQILFFNTSSPLSPGNHSLVITNLIPGGYFYLDHVDFTPQTELGMSNSNDDDDGDSGGHSGHGDKGHHSSNSDTSVVVGGVIGSLALIGLVIAALLTLKYYRRRQKRSIQVPDIPIYYSPPSVPPPSYSSRY